MTKAYRDTWPNIIIAYIGVLDTHLRIIDFASLSAQGHFPYLLNLFFDAAKPPPLLTFCLVSSIGKRTCFFVAPDNI